MRKITSENPQTQRVKDSEETLIKDIPFLLMEEERKTSFKIALTTKNPTTNTCIVVGASKG